jgi:hypothetical protein
MMSRQRLMGTKAVFAAICALSTVVGTAAALAQDTVASRTIDSDGLKRYHAKQSIDDFHLRHESLGIHGQL